MENSTSWSRLCISFLAKSLLEPRYEDLKIREFQKCLSRNSLIFDFLIISPCFLYKACWDESYDYFYRSRLKNIFNSYFDLSFNLNLNKTSRRKFQYVLRHNNYNYFYSVLICSGPSWMHTQNKRISEFPLIFVHL